ncbi:MAG: hypothetical protein WHV67_06430, partial [Thermoanaerobaculia bacterium]
HSMACGISLKENKIEDFRQNLKEISEGYEFKERILEIEEEITFKEFIEGFPYLLRMEPFGNKNPRPLFLSHNVSIMEEPKKINNLYFIKLVQGKEV